MAKYNHWTEQHPAVVAFLEQCFGEEVVFPEHGPDVHCGAATIEIKATNEWNHTSCANGKRRRGRFQFCGYEKADYVLFVLIRENETLEFFLDAFDNLPLKKEGVKNVSINWTLLFPNETTH